MRSRRRKRRAAPLAKSKEERCATKWCRNRRAFKKTYYKSASGKVIVYEGFLKFCWKCMARHFKERRPVTYTLNALRNRANSRGLPFTVTLAEFRDFCKRTGYMENRGREEHSATIDRVDHDKGYHIWNICVRPFLENCTNGHTVPGKDCKQNESVPEKFDYDYAGPEPENVVTDGNPF